MLKTALAEPLGLLLVLSNAKTHCWVCSVSDAVDISAFQKWKYEPILLPPDLVIPDPLLDRAGTVFLGFRLVVFHFHLTVLAASGR